MKFAGAIFDLDGTLTDSMYIWDRVPVELVRQLGGDPPEDLAEALKEMSREEAAGYMIETFGLDCTPREVLEGVNRLVDAEYRDRVPGKPGAARLLARLAALGISCCIATASEDYQARQAMERLGLWGYFRFAVSSTQYGSKTRPDIYLEAARRLGAEPGALLVVEDALHAARTAKAAGFRVAGVYDPTAREDREAMEQICDWYLPRLDDPEFLERLG